MSSPDKDSTALYPRVRLLELRLRHFRAFEDVRLALEDLTVLIGRNGAGKSTILEAFDFLRDALTDSLANALERRDDLQGIRQRQLPPSAPYDVHIAILIAIQKSRVVYGFRLGARKTGFVVKEEFLKSSNGKFEFERGEKSFKSDVTSISPVIDPEALLLPVIANQVSLWKIVRAGLSRVRTYSLSPPNIRVEPLIGSATWLDRYGANVGDVLKNLQRWPDDVAWVVKHLAALTPGITDVHAYSTGGRRYILFKQTATEGVKPYEFYSTDMSDGTLRCFALLLALRQMPRPLLVCFDEVEDSIHPSGLSVLLDAINATVQQQRCQVVISSHSPEALAHPSVTGKRVRIVEWRQGKSHVFDLSPGSKKLLKPPETVGRLLHSNALWPAEIPSVTYGNLSEISA